MSDSDHLLERVQDLRTIVPVFTEELASARRQAAPLRVHNTRLLEQVRELQRARRALRRAPRARARERGW
jgi:hypothetical protein